MNKQRERTVGEQLVAKVFIKNNLFGYDQISENAIEEIGNAYDALAAENEILKSKATQFESTMKETTRMRDELLAQAEAMAEALQVYEQDGTTAELALENWQKFKEQK